MNQARMAVAMAVVAVTLGTSVGAHSAATPTPRTGSATGTVTLPTLSVAGGTRSVSLGALTAAASSVGSPIAALRLAGAHVLGSTLPGWSVDSTGTDKTGDHTVPLGSAGTDGAVTLAGYDVAAAADRALARLGALSGALAVGALATRADLGTHGLSSAVTPGASTATIALDAVGARVRVGDLLPADVLGALPLSQLLTLAQTLQLPLPPDAAQSVAGLTSIEAVLTQLGAAASQLSTARQQLDALVAGVPGTAAAQQTLAAAQQQLATALAQLDAAQQQLAQDESSVQSLQNQVAAATATVQADQSSVDAATAQVAAVSAQLAANPLSVLLQQQLASAQATQAQAQSALSAAQAALAGLQQQLVAAQATVSTDQQTLTTSQQAASAAQADVDAAQATLDTLLQAAADPAVVTAQQLAGSLTSTVDGLLTQLTSQVQSLPDLHALLTQVLDLVTSAPLVDLGTVAMQVTSVADDDAGRGAATCALHGLTVLAAVVPATTCEQARATFAAAVTSLRAALAALPGAVAVPTPVLDGLQATTTGGPAGAGAASTGASASLTPLHLGLPSIALTAVSDTVVTAVDTSIGQLTTLLAGLGLPSGTSALTGAVGTLGVDVGSLPTGAALAGLHTVGLDLTVAGLATSVLHYRSAAAPALGAPGTATPGTTTPGTTTPGTTTPGTTTPGTTTPGTNGDPATPGRHPSTGDPGGARLPFTGLDAAADLALGALTLLMGAHLVLLGRRRRSG